MLERLSDGELMQLVQKKDLDALKELYARYERLTYSLAMKTLRNSQEAEEVVQDVFMKLWNKSTLYDPSRGQKFSSWLLRICQNAAIDKLKSRRGADHLDDEKFASIPDIRIDLDNELEMRSLKNRIKEALRKLPEEQREIIELLYFEGFTHSEVAEGMGIPLGTVKSRARLAMVKLKRLLNGEGVRTNAERI